MDNTAFLFTPMQNDLYIGLMSGTSTDGIDAVLADFTRPQHPRIVTSVSIAIDESLRTRLLRLNSPGPNELEQAYLAANDLSKLYAEACHRLLIQHPLHPHQIRAIGAHGQTVRHKPELGYSIQLNAPALLAELTGIDVIADFRSRDIAAGGQGAPLVPVVHQGLFSSDVERVVLNLGGIANLSILSPTKPLQGFDTGPANMLMDYWAQQHLSTPYDHNGNWAAKGTVIPELLTAMLADDWFALPPPKSTGRDLFNATWLQQHLNAYASAKPHDIQATLLALTVESIALAISEHAPAAAELLVCGGGALNTTLLESLKQRLNIAVLSTETLGINPLEVEALAFAWLAYAHLNRIKANAPAVTGAKHAAILGAYYPA